MPFGLSKREGSYTCATAFAFFVSSSTFFFCSGVRSRRFCACKKTGTPSFFGSAVIFLSTGSPFANASLIIFLTVVLTDICILRYLSRLVSDDMLKSSDGPKAVSSVIDPSKSCLDAVGIVDMTSLDTANIADAGLEAAVLKHELISSIHLDPPFVIGHFLDLTHDHGRCHDIVAAITVLNDVIANRDSHCSSPFLADSSVSECQSDRGAVAPFVNSCIRSREAGSTEATSALHIPHRTHP